ncbi:hypothetical protein A3L11_07895 [Thermococcus siculi]|uniref:Ribonuclease VapC n=1 Tax=Thermococcus siculi TaxID=72803 RepID=A0A2Z2MQZ6_9EURY|nr:type II toxin-antitoxin system VapC family toxin [Thermococcus siculi]ASJ09154.1 hypothetical protein A3L11_07895 [Thermococcus siculi]
MIVADASFIVDALVVPRRKKKDKLYEKQMKRHRQSLELLSFFLEEGFQMYMPFLGLVEVSSLLTRKLGRESNVEAAIEFLRRYISIVPESELRDELIDVARTTGSRAADVYYVSLAKLKGAVLVTADRRMAEVAEEMGVKVILLE